MSKKHYFLFAIFIALSAVSCAATPKVKPEPTLDELKQKPYSELVEVSIGDNFYKPKQIEVPSNSIVVWKNIGNVGHNVVSYKIDGAGKEKFTSPVLSPEKEYGKKFGQKSANTTYYYYCTIHGKAQSGEVVVTE